MNTALIVIAMAATSSPNLQSILDRARTDQEIPGVSAVVTLRGEVLFAGASGVADLESKRRMTPDTILYAGSVTKVFTALLTLQLAERGKLSLDEVVAGIADNDIKVRQLLTHSSGLNREGDFDYWFTAEFPDKAALARYLLDTDLVAHPGSMVRYSNIGYAALGPVIERATGQNYADALLTRVFMPLGMVSSGAYEPGADLSAGYSPVDHVLPNKERPFAGLGHRVGKRNVREYHDAGAMTPAFGAFTTARDLSRLARFLLGYADDEVLSTAMRSRMLTLQVEGRGFGVRLTEYKGRPVARHGGWFAAHQAHLLLDLQSGISVVVLANSDSASPAKIAEALIDYAFECLQPAC